MPAYLECGVIGSALATDGNRKMANTNKDNSILRNVILC